MRRIQNFTRGPALRLAVAALAFLAIALAACAPTATAIREGETVTVTIAPTQDLHGTYLSVLNAATTDARCVPQNEGRDIICSLATIPAGTTVTVTFTGTLGQVDCRIFAWLDPTLSIPSLRTYKCSGGG